ncbi:MAG TPA: hypothetical protein VJA21_04360 [Verrucomicrobiae bacterium]
MKLVESLGQMLVRLIEYLQNRLKTVVWACCGVLALLILCDVVIKLPHLHSDEPWFEKLPVFWSIFGFIGCALIIILSKWYGHAGIMTREDYYGPEEGEKAPPHHHD